MTAFKIDVDDAAVRAALARLAAAAKNPPDCFPMKGPPPRLAECSGSC
jgi:hypothetical protein